MRCAECGEDYPSEFYFEVNNICKKCFDSASEEKKKDVVNRQTDSSFGKRYRDAYIVANTTVGVGSTIKVVGAVLGALVALLSLSLNSFSGSLALLGVLLGVVVGAIFFMFGVLVSAQGQVLRATLDNAVFSCPLLNDDQKAQIAS